MTDNTMFGQNIDTVFTDLHNFAKSDSILGTPLPVGDKTLVPIMSVTLGYGSAEMPKKAQSNSNSNGNSISSNNNNNGLGGLGAKISADAVVVVEKDSVTMLNVGQKNNMNQLMDKIPEALTNISQNLTQKGKEAQNQQQGQQQPQPQNQPK